MTKASFLIWTYKFYDDRVEMIRNFYFTKKKTIETYNIESVTLISGFILLILRRTNLVIFTHGNVFILFGVPTKAANELCSNYTDSGEEKTKIRLSNSDLIKTSLLKSRIKWYFILLAVMWTIVIIFGGRYLTEEQAIMISEFAFKQVMILGAFVMSLTLPHFILWIWALTGGIITVFIKYFNYSATRYDDVLCFEYGLIFHRKVFIPTKRITVVEYIQSPLMQFFQAGKIKIHSVGYNAHFIRSDTLLPFVTEQKKSKIIYTLLPEFELGKELKPNNSLLYLFLYFTNFIMFIPLVASFFFGYGWTIVALLLVLANIGECFLLHYHNTLLRSERITYISRGGYNRSSSFIRNDMIESVTLGGSKHKLKKGFANLSIKVFGKKNFAIRVRSIDIDVVNSFNTPNDTI